MTMAFTIKDTDFIGTRQLLLGLLLSLSVSPVLVSGSLITESPGDTTNMNNITSTTESPAIASNTTTNVPTMVMTTIVQTSTSTQPSVSSPSTAPTSTSQSMSTLTSTGAGSTSTVSTVPYSSITSNTGMNASVSTASMGNTTDRTNGTTPWNNSSMSMISCPSFMCNYSECYSMYTSQNVTMCSADYNYCELIKQMGMCYTVSCSASCSSSCVNASQSNCSVNCCNSTGCLNDSFASLMVTSTVMPSTTLTTTTKTTTAAPTTLTGNKCHTGKCNGTDCYKSFFTLQICISSQPHCHLKKETVGTNLQWTAGCTTNCSGQTTCKASTQPPCFLECCNATMSSCLWLNGTLNVPSFATRGPQLHSELITFALVLFAISLML